jgi:hypothetical protein
MFSDVCADDCNLWPTYMLLLLLLLLLPAVGV